MHRKVKPLLPRVLMDTLKVSQAQWHVSLCWPIEDLPISSKIWFWWVSVIVIDGFNHHFFIQVTKTKLSNNFPHHLKIKLLFVFLFSSLANRSNKWTSCELQGSTNNIIDLSKLPNKQWRRNTDTHDEFIFMDHHSEIQPMRTECREGKKN